MAAASERSCCLRVMDGTLPGLHIFAVIIRYSTCVPVQIVIQSHIRKNTFFSTKNRILPKYRMDMTKPMTEVPSIFQARLEITRTAFNDCSA
jgi:hypothetical protein